jgi:hypothetical protein
LYRFLRLALERFGEGFPKPLFSLLLFVSPGMALFMIGWLVYALLTGFALKVLIDRQARTDAAMISRAFD